MLRPVAFVLLPLLALLLPIPAAADYSLEEWVTGLAAPVCVTAPPGDTDRLFIVEQSGRIRIFENGNLNAAPFLNVSAITSTGGERGLLGLAFHPDYANNGWFYINHTGSSGACAGAAGCTIVARYSVSGDPDLADPGSRAQIIRIAQPYSNHNGGGIEFGPDGYLYIGMGDGGSGGDPGNRSQNDGQLLGKMLRLDVDSGLPYSIPEDNPHVGEGLPLDEIWAKGLRNPWRFSFDRLTGDLWIGDVGQYIWEEVDFQPAASTGGENYGWRLMEGNHCFNPANNCDLGGLTYPIWEYDHNSGCSITGGYVYRGASIPELQGLYLYADYCNGRIWAFDPADSSNTLILTDQNVGNITSFGEDADGELYLTTGNKVWRFAGTATGVGALPPSRSDLRFEPASPNPFRGETRVRLQLPRDTRHGVTVGVYTVGGRRVNTLHSGAASGDALTLIWDGRNTEGKAVPSGVYFLRANAGGKSSASRVVVLR